MSFRNIIDRAVAENRATLTEAESKSLLKEFGVPVVDEIVVPSLRELGKTANKLPFPVAVKGLGAKLTHKTDKGLVKLGLKNQSEVMEAAAFISDAAGHDLEGFLVQPMVEGKRELVAGLFFDPQFGPSVMFGLGGIFTEAVGDVVFRLTPFNETEARVMIQEIKAQKLLGDFRGEKAADVESIVKILTALSTISAAIPEIHEIDINPLIISPDGSITAVDALIVLGKRVLHQSKRQPIDISKIQHFLNPESIAFIGATEEFAKWGHKMYSNVMAGKFQGKCYMVNIRGGEIAGMPVYKSVRDIPAPVDLAVVTIPANKVLPLLDELKEKHIKSVVLITSGFRETGAEGKQLEEKLVRKASENGVLILGPNTMGICNPWASFYCTGSHVRPIAGGTAFVSQSGNLGTQLMAFAKKEGIGIRVFCGSGNEAMIAIEDYMEFFAHDEMTKTLVMYIESIKNGRRFLETATEIGLSKPVIALKGGRTAEGAKAAASHTGAMASNIKVFEAVCKQSGIVYAEHPMDLLDLSASFSSLPLPKGNRVAIMTFGGGWGVVASDLCSENGLEVPPLPPDLVERINKLLPPFWSHTNPIDLVGDSQSNVQIAVLSELMQWDGCDAVIHMGILGRKLMVEESLNSTLYVSKNLDVKFKESIMATANAVENKFIRQISALMAKYNKPVVGVYWQTDDTTSTILEIENEKYKGIAFPSPERAANVLVKMNQYSRWLNNHKK